MLIVWCQCDTAPYVQPDSHDINLSLAAGLTFVSLDNSVWSFCSSMTWMTESLHSQSGAPHIEHPRVWTGHDDEMH